MIFGKSKDQVNIEKLALVRKIPVDLNKDIKYFVTRTLDLLRELTFASYGNCYFFNINKDLVSFTENEEYPELKKLAAWTIIQDENQFINHKDNNFDIKYNSISANIKIGTRFAGCICLIKTNNEYNFHQNDFKLLEGFVASLGTQIGGIKRIGKKNLVVDFQKSLLPILEKTWLEQKIHDAKYRLDSVLDVSNLINSSSQLDDMIESILLSSRKVMRAESASMFLVEKQTQDLLFSIVSNKKEKDLTGYRVPRGQGIVGLCAQNKKTIVVEDAQNDDRVFHDAGKSVQYVTKNLIAAPLLVNNECIGVIEVLNKIGKSRFSKNDAELFESFADSVALAVQRRILTDELEDSNKQLASRLRETQTLHAVTAAMIQEDSIEEMFGRVLNEIKSNMEIEIITVMIFNHETNALEIAATSNEQFKNKNIDCNKDSVAKSVFTSNQALLIKDIHSDPVLSKLASTNRYKSGSCILVPLSTGKDDKPIGLLCASEPKEGKFQNEDFVLLKTIAVQLLRGYQNIQMKDAVLAKKAIEKELEITSRIQQNILPNSFQNHQHIKLDAMSIMAKTTGGDFFDHFIHKDNGPASFLVADVSGKSLPAALFMAVSSSILRTFIRMDLEPMVTLGQANDLLYEESESGMFVTVFLSHYDPASGILKYASGGHNEMILMHKNGNYELLSGKGHPLGILPTYLQKYKGGELEIQKDDLLVLYSDGIVEAEDPNYNEYGMQRFIDVLQKNRYKPVDEMVQNVYQSVEKFSDQKDLSDDFTLMVIRFPKIITGQKNYSFVHPIGRDSIPSLRDKVKDICTNHGLYGEVLEDILLVCDEAATNIVTHAFNNENNQVSETFECDLQIESRNFIRLLFKDKGKPFDLEKVASPNISENLSGKRNGGFGVFLIRSLTNKLEYERKEDTNYLIIEKKLAIGNKSN